MLRLRQFDLVLVLETAAECEAAVRLTLGWTETLMPRRNMANESNARGYAHGRLGSRSAASHQESDEAVLRTQNKWDLALYRDAQAIASASCAALDRVANDQSYAVRKAIAAYRVARRAACDPHTRVAPADQRRLPLRSSDRRTCLRCGRYTVVVSVRLRRNFTCQRTSSYVVS